MGKSGGTPVKCMDCGHEWETVAEYPQCSDPNDECNRSRNVEQISDTEGDSGGMSERDPEPSGDSQAQGEWSPLFDAQDTETEPVEDMSIDEPPELEDSHAEAGPAQSGEPSEDSPEIEGQNVPELEPEDIRFFVKTPFDMASRTRGEHWELNDEELDQLSHAYTRVGNKYAPYMLKEHAPEVMATMATVSVVGPRMAQDKKEAQEEKEPETDTEPREESDRSSDQSDAQMSDGELRQTNTAYDKI